MFLIDREIFLHTVVSGGGAMLVGYAWYLWAADRAGPQQIRGLATAGAGFLASAGASVYLRDYAVLGPTVSLVGSVVALSGMRTVLRDRVDRQDAARRAAPPGRAGE